MRWLVGLLLLGLVVVAPAAPAKGVDDRFTVTTQNVRQGLPLRQARHDIRQAAEHSSLVVTQEMGTRVDERFAPEGWGWVHFSGLRRGDCATFYDRGVWRLVRAWIKPITFAQFRAGHRFVLATVLRNRASGNRLGLVCVH